jgi:hypothetical protein
MTPASATTTPQRDQTSKACSRFITVGPIPVNMGPVSVAPEGA